MSPCLKDSSAFMAKEIGTSSRAPAISGEARIGRISGALALEQLSALLVRPRGAGQDERVIISHPLLLSSSSRKSGAILSRKGWGTRQL